jgi:GDPmannose 4,6-dehydratase
MPTALITGIAGQDGSYLAEFLVSKDYEVIGTTRNARRALELPYARAFAGVDLVEVTGNPASPEVGALIDSRRPDEIYHLGGPSSVSRSWADPAETMAGIVLPVGMMVEQLLEMLPAPRLFFAGSSEVFAAQDSAQDENAPHNPESPYARAKQEASEFVGRAREFGLYAVTGVLFNHESPRRAETSQSRPPVSLAGCSSDSRSATSTFAGTGDSPGTTCGPCG